MTVLHVTNSISIFIVTRSSKIISSKLKYGLRSKEHVFISKTSILFPWSTSSYSCCSHSHYSYTRYNNSFLHYRFSIVLINIIVFDQTVVWIVMTIWFRDHFWTWHCKLETINTAPPPQLTSCPNCALGLADKDQHIQIVMTYEPICVSWVQWLTCVKI